MVKRLKKWGRVLLFAAGAVALLGVALLEGVDYKPHFAAPYHRTTLARLQKELANPGMVEGPLFAGMGRARLTPTIGTKADHPEAGEFQQLPLAGFGNRKGKPATGVHDDLFAKAAAIKVSGKTVVMVAADALIIPSEIAEAAAAELKRDAGLDRSQIYFGATHTHSSLGGWGEGIVSEMFAGGYQPGTRVWFARQLASAAKAAIADLAPASAGSTNISLPQHVRNRLVGELGTIDDTLSLLALKQTNGNQIVLSAYAAHATVLGGKNMQFSADYPGYYQREVETNIQGTAIFFAGAVGSQGPVAKGEGFKGAEALGKAVADAVLTALPRIPMTNVIQFAALTLETELPEQHVRLLDQWRLHPALSKKLLPVEDRVLLQGFRIGNAIWLSTPCDFSGEMSASIKESLRVRGFLGAITSFNGDYIGYVVPGRYYHWDSYESRTMSFFGPTVPDYLDDLIRRMANGLASLP